jgi:chromosomal replication initiation ATPase DnaA
MAGLTNIGDAVAATLRSVEDAREYTRQREERELEDKFRKEHEARMAAEPQTEEEKAKAEEAALLKQNIIMLNKGIERAKAAMRKEAVLNAQLEIEDVFQAHARMLLWIANNVVLAHQRRKFVVDENNRDILRFLLYYFNGCPKAEEVFPNRGYKLHKHIMLMGEVGTGKTLLMQIFSEYMHYTNNPRAFYNLSVTQMVNYYTLHNNLDRYTYYEEENRGFQCTPVNICLNDIGTDSITFFGMDTKLLTNQFLHARNEIWVHYHKYAHVTTNLTMEQLKEEYKDGFGRLVDRFKTYNIVPLGGKSRR